MRIVRTSRRPVSADFYGAAVLSSVWAVAPDSASTAAVRAPPCDFAVLLTCQHQRLTRRSSGTLRDKAAQRPLALR